MERIRLTKNEKTVLRMLASGYNYPSTFPSHRFAKGAEGLEKHGLARCAWVEGRRLEAVSITECGKYYLSSNPSLRNPIDWKWLITIILSALGTIIAVVSLFVACKIAD